MHFELPGGTLCHALGTNEQKSALSFLGCNREHALGGAEAPGPGHLRRGGGRGLGGGGAAEGAAEAADGGASGGAGRRRWGVAF